MKWSKNWKKKSHWTKINFKTTHHLPNSRFGAYHPNTTRQTVIDYICRSTKPKSTIPENTLTDWTLSISLMLSFSAIEVHSTVPRSLHSISIIISFLLLVYQKAPSIVRRFVISAVARWILPASPKFTNTMYNTEAES